MKNNPLANLWNTPSFRTGGQTTSTFLGGNYNPQGNNYNPQTQTETLPYGGGTFNPSGGAKITPSPVFTGVPPTASEGPAPGSEGDLYSKYRDPKTGEIMSPEEYAIYLGNKVPKGTGEISNYAGDVLASPDKTANELVTAATNLNRSRNDIATGTTDPYKAGNLSGIAYSPAELKAIEKAYAGIYDPVLNDVFSRLRDKQEADAKIIDREDRIFATNEAIRQWQATTGTTGSGSDANIFTQTQLNTGASNARLRIDSFSLLDNDIKNFFINPPTDIDDTTGKSYPMNVTYDNLIMQALEGEITIDDASDEILTGNIPSSVKHYYIDQLPAEDTEKEGWFKRVWGAVKGN